MVIYTKGINLHGSVSIERKFQNKMDKYHIYKGERIQKKESLKKIKTESIYQQKE